MGWRLAVTSRGGNAVVCHDGEDGVLVECFLVGAFGAGDDGRHVACQYNRPLLAFLLAKFLLLGGIDVLEGFLLGAQELKGRAFDGKAVGHGLVGGGVLARTEGVVQSVVFGEIALQVPPHEPQEGGGAAAAAEVGAHDEVEEVARRLEVDLGDLGGVLREDEDEVDGVCTRDGLGHDVFDGAGLLRVLGGALEDGLEARGILQLLVCVGVLVGLQRGDGVVGPQLGAHLGEEVQGGVHAAHVDQQAHHGHVDGGRPLRQQLVLEDLAALAALGHGVQVDVGKGEALVAVHLGEDALLVIEDVLEEVVLDVLAPQRDAVVLLEVADLVARID